MHLVAVRGVLLAGLTTKVFPAKSPGAILFPINETGKFHGTIAPQTPIGRLIIMPYLPVSNNGT